MSQKREISHYDFGAMKFHFARSLAKDFSYELKKLAKNVSLAHLVVKCYMFVTGFKQCFVSL